MVPFGTKVCISVNKDFGINVYIMSKYDEVVLKIVSKEEIKSTNEILAELQQKTGKTINWHALYRILMELKDKNKIEKLKSRAGFFWKKK